MPQDNPEHLEYIRKNWNDDDIEASVKRIVSDSGIFLKDFDAIVPGFAKEAAEYVRAIRNGDIRNALKNFLAAN